MSWKPSFFRDIECTDIVYRITLQIESATQTLRMEALDDM